MFTYDKLKLKGGDFMNKLKSIYQNRLIKRTICVFFLLSLCFSFTACDTFLTRDNHFGFDPNDFTIIEDSDDTGFFGDGTESLILDCSENSEKSREIVKDWNPMPLSENLELIMYGGTKNGIYYGYNLAERVNWPRIENGVYKFIDRHDLAKENERTDDTYIFARYSFNFTLAAYDYDTDIYYYFEFDT